MTFKIAGVLLVMSDFIKPAYAAWKAHQETGNRFMSHSVQQIISGRHEVPYLRVACMTFGARDVQSADALGLVIDEQLSEVD